MKSSVRLGIVAAFILATGIGGAAGLFLVTRCTTSGESAAAILQKAAAEQSQTLAALGPNTTLHAIAVNHREQFSAVRNTSSFALPDDTISEGFIAFDAAGKVSSLSSVFRGTDGHVYQHLDLIGGETITTDVASGQTLGRCQHEAPCPPLGNYAPGDGPVRSIEDERVSISRASQQIANALTSSAMATPTSLNGAAVFLIETNSPSTPGGAATYIAARAYISQSDYRILRTEQLAPDGHVTSYTMQTVQEVLPGAVTGPTATP